MILKYYINKKGLQNVLSFWNDMQSNLLKILQIQCGAENYIKDLLKLLGTTESTHIWS